MFCGFCLKQSLNLHFIRSPEDHLRVRLQLRHALKPGPKVDALRRAEPLDEGRDVDAAWNRKTHRTSTHQLKHIEDHGSFPLKSLTLVRRAVVFSQSRSRVVGGDYDWLPNHE